MIILNRLNNNQPILKPRPGITWEAKGICNPGAIKHNNKIVLLYRAYDAQMHSSFGLATSSDGINFEYASTHPVFEKQIGVEYEKDGIENPRLTQISDTVHILYTSAAKYDFPNQTPDHIWKTAVCRATTQNFTNFTREGIVLNSGLDKDAALFPEKINGFYYMYHRSDELHIGLSKSPDLINWQLVSAHLLSSTSNTWEDERVSIGPPPIKTTEGWLSFYHGRSQNAVYSISAFLSDSTDPSKILARLNYPLLQPELEYEKQGSFPNTVYSNGAVEMGDQIYLYYGCADYAIGVASISKAIFNATTI